MFKAFTSLSINQCQTLTSCTLNLVYHPIVNRLKYVIVGELKMSSQNAVKLALSVVKLSSLQKVKSSQQA